MPRLESSIRRVNQGRQWITGLWVSHRVFAEIVIDNGRPDSVTRHFGFGPRGLCLYQTQLHERFHKLTHISALI